MCNLPEPIDGASHDGADVRLARHVCAHRLDTLPCGRQCGELCARIGE